MIGALAAAVDRAATAAVRLSQGRSSAPSDPWDDEARIALLGAVRDQYATHASEVFSTAQAIEPLLTRGTDCFDMSWPSRHCVLDARVGDELGLYPVNSTCHVRLRARSSGRPAVIFVHGYLAGDFEFNERVWPLARFDALGFDTALFTLPFHGRRSVPHLRRSPPFPGRDPAMTIEGFRQAVGDLRELIAWLKAQGSSAVGLVGMSLGGYTAALTATVEPELAFLVPVIPLACLADFAREQGNLPRGAALGLRYETALREAYRVVSPLARTPLIEPRRTLVIGAQADRITHVSHARRIAHHFSAPLHTWPGGHLVQWGRSEAFDRVEAFLRDLGLIRG
jgi:pimeloyl-ACP methyl ester carboxylesterase